MRLNFDVVATLRTQAKHNYIHSNFNTDTFQLHQHIRPNEHAMTATQSDNEPSQSKRKSIWGYTLHGYGRAL